MAGLEAEFARMIDRMNFLCNDSSLKAHHCRYLLSYKPSPLSINLVSKNQSKDGFSKLVHSHMLHDQS